MIYSPFNQNNFLKFETYNANILLASTNNPQFTDIPNRSTSKYISKSLAATCTGKNEFIIKEHNFYAKESNILMAKPVTGIVDTPVYTPKYNSQNDPSIYISIGDVSDYVISQHDICSYTPQTANKQCKRSLSHNSLEAENYLNIDPYKRRRQNKRDILELKEAYAELKAYEKETVKCMKCQNDVSKNRSFIYSGNNVCAKCATKIQSNYLQDWTPRETRGFTGTLRKCDNCKRKRPASQFVYKTFTGELDYNPLCRFCLLKKETCSHQSSFKKRYYNLYKYKTSNDYNDLLYNNNDYAMVNSNSNNDNYNNDIDDYYLDDDDDEFILDNEKLNDDNNIINNNNYQNKNKNKDKDKDKNYYYRSSNKLTTKTKQTLSPQMIQSHPQDDKIGMPKKRGRKRKNPEGVHANDNNEVVEQVPPPPPPPPPPPIKKTYIPKSTILKSNSIIKKFSFDDESNININLNRNNNYKYTNRISNNYYNTFLSVDIHNSKPSSQNLSSKPPTSLPSQQQQPYPPSSFSSSSFSFQQQQQQQQQGKQLLPQSILSPHSFHDELQEQLDEKVKELQNVNNFHSKVEIAKFENEERLVVSDIEKMPLNIGQAFKLYQANLKMCVRCIKCNKNVLKDRCIVDSDKCYVCSACMKKNEDKFDWSVLENNKSVNDILCRSCNTKKSVDQFLKLDNNDVIYIQNICRHCLLTKGNEATSIR